MAVTSKLRDDDTALLDHLIDSFDRLYDKNCLTVDVYALLFATSRALTDPEFKTATHDAAEALKKIIRSPNPESARNDAGLCAVQPLREKICSALVWDLPKIT